MSKKAAVRTQKSGKKETTANRAIKKKARKVEEGKIKITCSFNNTIITATDDKGNTLAWSTAGKHFKGSRKSTPFAAQTAAEEVCKKIQENNEMKRVAIILVGPGTGRDASLRAIGASGLKITIIIDGTPLPHNGCRPPKERRV